MLAIVAAIIFVIGYIIHATGTATDAAVSATGLLLLGLACLAVHQAGFGTSWKIRYRRRRR